MTWQSVDREKDEVVSIVANRNHEGDRISMRTRGKLETWEALMTAKMRFRERASVDFLLRSALLI